MAISVEVDLLVPGVHQETIKTKAILQKKTACLLKFSCPLSQIAIKGFTKILNKSILGYISLTKTTSIVSWYSFLNLVFKKR